MVIIRLIKYELLFKSLDFLSFDNIYHKGNPRNMQTKTTINNNKYFIIFFY